MPCSIESYPISQKSMATNRDDKDKIFEIIRLEIGFTKLDRLVFDVFGSRVI